MHQLSKNSFESSAYNNKGLYLRSYRPVWRFTRWMPKHFLSNRTPLVLLAANLVKQKGHFSRYINIRLAT
jgi:hypothetical protein